MPLRLLAPKLLHFLAVLFLLILIGGPLLACVVQLASGDEAAQAGQTFEKMGAWTYFEKGVAAAIGAMTLAILLGAALGLAGLPAKGRWLAWGALIPLIVPPTVYGLCWNALWPAPKSEALALLRAMTCLGLGYTPLVFLLVLAARSLQDPAIDETARLAPLPRWRRLWRIDLPAIRGSAAAGGLAVFLLTFSSFEMPSALNFSSFPEVIYQRYMATYSLGAPAALAIAGASPALILAFLAWRALHRNGGRPLEFQPRLPCSTPGARWPWVLWLGYIAVAALLPAAGMVYRVGGHLTGTHVGRDLLDGARDTLPVVLGALLATLVLGWVLADVILAHKYLALPVLGLLFLGTGIAPAVIGIGLIQLWIRLPLVYGTNAMYQLALMARFLALPALLFAAARRLLPSDFLDSARLSNLSPWRQQIRLLIPVLAGSWAAISAPCLALMLGELGATTLLSAPGTELLSFRLHSRIHIGPESWVAAFSLAYAALVLLLAAALWLSGKWILQGGRSRHGLS